MITPTINLNGTSEEELIIQLVNASNALTGAIEVMAKATPHLRDYPKSPDDYTVARLDHNKRVKQVREVAQELQSIALKLLVHD